MQFFTKRFMNASKPAYIAGADTTEYAVDGWGWIIDEG